MRRNVWVIFLLVAVVTSACGIFSSFSSSPIDLPTPSSTSSVTPLPSPSSTSSVTPSPVPSPTSTPTPDFAAVLKMLAVVARGQGVPEARPYTPDTHESPTFVILDKSGNPHPWNAHLPIDWLPESIADTDLVVILLEEREITLNTQRYTGGPPITRYRYEMDGVVREAHTGKDVLKSVLEGVWPEAFPDVAPVDQTRLEGDRVSYTHLEAWLYWLVPSLRPLTGHTGPVLSVAFSPDGKILASGSEDETIRLWRVEENTHLRTLEGHTGYVSSVAFSPNGEFLASGSWDGTIRFWKAENGTQLRILEGQTGSVSSIAFSPKGDLIASGSGDGTVRIWRVEDGKRLRTIMACSYGVLSVAFSPDGATLATSGRYPQDTVQFWRVEDGSLLVTLEENQSNWTSNNKKSIGFSPDGDVLVSGSDEGILFLWNVKDGSLLRTLEVQKGSSWSVVALSPNGEILSSGYSDRTIHLWRLKDGTHLNTLLGHADNVLSLAFSPVGNILASGSRDETIRIWHIEGMLD